MSPHASTPSQVARADNAEVAAYHKLKVKTSSEQQLQALVTEFGFCLSFFERWKERGVRTVSELNAGLKGLDCVEPEPTPQQRRQAVQAKLDWLREQIEMRTRGLQWVDLKAAPAWSSCSDHQVKCSEYRVVSSE